MTEKKFLSVSEAARELGVAPKLLSDLFWQEKADLKRCFLVGTRRVVPADYLPELRRILQARQAAARRVLVPPSMGVVA